MIRADGLLKLKFTLGLLACSLNCSFVYALLLAQDFELDFKTPGLPLFMRL